MVQVFYSKIAKEKHEHLLKEFLPLHPSVFRERIMSYRKWQDAQLSLLGRMLLQTGLKEFGSCYRTSEIELCHHNKPFLRNSTINFNISHSGSVAVCVLIDGYNVGIDIELMSDDVAIEDFKSQMTKSEWHTIINSSDIQASFYKYWTQKEALVKADGSGLLIPLNSFEIINDEAIINFKKYYLHEIFIDKSYMCYIASDMILNYTEIKIVEII